jgi:hypothetical protein
LISIVNDYGETDRYICPLERGITCIPLKRPGKNKILSTIIWREDGNIRIIKKELLPRSAYVWKVENGLISSKEVLHKVRVLDYSKKKFRGEKNNCDYILTDNILRLSSQTEIEVIMPENVNFFAKEPPTWKLKWINLWFKNLPEDQCQYRKRCLIAYTIQPPIVFLWFVLTTLFRLMVYFLKIIFKFLKSSILSLILSIKSIFSLTLSRRKEKKLLKLLEKPRESVLYLKFLKIKSRMCKPFCLDI